MAGGFVYEEVAEKVEALIRGGVLRRGSKAPSLRKLSDSMGVSITTVMKAYDLLEGQGLLEVWPRSGYYVRDLGGRAPNPAKSSVVDLEATEVTKNALIAGFLRALGPSDVNRFSCATPDMDLLPIRTLSKLAGSIARDNGRSAFDYAFPPGHLELRRQIAARAVDCRLTADDVVVTSGGLDALNLCLNAVAKPGDAIAIETPTYFGVLQAIENHGMRAVEVPTCPQHGIDLNILDEVLGKDEVKACLLIPNFNNPMGSLMPEQSKRDLVEILGRRNKFLIEDDVYGDLYFAKTRPKSVKAFDTEDRVLLCSSFSKSLSPGLRIGYMASHRFAPIIKELQFMSTVSAPTLSQEVIASFLASGRYDRHLRDMRKTLKTNICRANSLITETFPAGTRVSQPEGGFVLWIELPEGMDTIALGKQAQARGIGFAPGPLFTARADFGNCLRLNCGWIWNDEVEAGLRLIAEVVCAGTPVSPLGRSAVAV